MFAAHLVFGDINGHSQLPFEQRAIQLERFWGICEQVKPRRLDNDRYSFYDVDNDAIMVGLSDFQGLQSGEEVLGWVVDFHTRLRREHIPATFAVNLLALGRPLQWPRLHGRIDRPELLYTPDDIHAEDGRVRRSRVAGDAMIVAARLLALAKKTRVPIALSVFQGGHLDGDPERLHQSPRLAGRISISDITDNYALLPSEHEEWLRTRNVKAWGCTIIDQDG